MTAPSNRHTPLFAAFVACGSLALSACGSGSEADAGDSELPTLETSQSATDEGPDAEQAANDTEMTADEAALALSECLRSEGIDVPDIGLDATGNIDLRGSLGETGRDPTFRAAMQECQGLLDGIGFGGGGRGALADNTEIQDAFLEFSDCIRDNGFDDIPDLTLGGPGQGAGGAPPADGSIPDGAGPGQGNREGGFGDRSSIFADRLGLDPDDPEVIAALDTCTPIIDRAFSDAGVGQPGEGA